MDGEDKIIETDSDTREEEGIDENQKSFVDPIFEDIQMEEQPFSVFEYIRKYNQGKLDIQPDFQRNLVWNNAKKCSFIESVFLNFPIPPIYLNQKIDGNYIVIDGLQRTTTLLNFYNNEFKLEGLDALKNLNGDNFQSLSPALQTKFEDKKLTVFVLKPSTPMRVIYDLFNRINTNGTPLNRQEVRNCIFIGRSTRLLKELSEKDYFKQAIDYGINPIRMKDREAVLRYIAFRWFDYHTEYDGNMSNYLENAMTEINKLDDFAIDEIITDFERVMKLSFTLFEKSNFRIPTEYTRGTINMAILETICYFLSTISDEKAIKNKSKIMDNYKKLLNNNKYRDSVSTSTSNTQKVLNRFGLSVTILSENLE